MTPNLRFDKSLTKKLLKSSKGERLSSMSIKWNLENNPDKIYGSYYTNLFGTVYGFFIQRIDEETYRLVMITSKGKIMLFIIDDIDLYLEQITVQELFVQNTQIMADVFAETKKLLSAGLVVIEEDKTYIYVHSNE
jgi:hypothetical protein